MKNLIFNEKLHQKLDRMNRTALTAVEAPAGYGKTTVLHDILDQSGETVFWYTAVEAVPDTSYRWFIRQLSLVDESASERLVSLGFLNRSNADEAGRIISGIDRKSGV